MTEFVPKMDDFVPKICEFPKITKLRNSKKIKNFFKSSNLKKIGQTVLFELFRFRVPPVGKFRTSVTTSESRTPTQKSGANALTTYHKESRNQTRDDKGRELFWLHSRHPKSEIDLIFFKQKDFLRQEISSPSPPPSIAEKEKLRRKGGEGGGRGRRR